MFRPVAAVLLALGLALAIASGQQQDDKVLQKLRLAADQGNARAQFNLGVMYDRGEGVPQDYVWAHKWMNLAASRTGEERDKYVKARDSVAEKMTASQIAEALRLAREWKPKGGPPAGAHRHADL